MPNEAEKLAICGMCHKEPMTDEILGLCDYCAEQDRDYKDDLMEGMRMPYDLS